MPYPDPPEIATSYTAIEQSVGDGSLPGQELDVDLAALRDSVAAVIAFLKAFTRSDGRLANGTVTADTLASDILLGVSPPAPWETGRPYAPPETVFSGNRFYIAATSHTSSDFATDLASGRWVLLADFVPPGGGLLAANNLGDLVDAAAARANLLLGTAAEADLGTGSGEIRTNSQNSAVFQPLNANLTAEAGLTGAADQVSYYTGAGAKALTTLTSFSRSLAAASTASAARSTLGLGSLAVLSAITADLFAAAAIVTASEGLTSSNNDTSFPTTAAVLAAFGGASRTYTDVSGSRVGGTTYTNPGPFERHVSLRVSEPSGPRNVETSPDGVTWTIIGTFQTTPESYSFCVGAGHRYRINGNCTISVWAER